ncbi:MAG: putative protein YphB [Paracidovorax wautersii]|uniref:Aldose 1-epimerase n=1 Tax=Paracidovorax wautersii TaxID=1177982 RepID=A0A7V8FMV8_9BURK|nr:MAG: putative protein YphB [Paracidovorax wautersii]
MTRPSPSPELELRSPALRLTLAPAWGGRLTRLQALMGAQAVDLVVPLQAPSFDPLAWPKAGAYPLMPYSNRIRHARLVFGGHTHGLQAHPAALPHTLHGPAHTLPWQVEHADATHAVLGLRCPASAHWPWAFSAWQRYTLDGQGLRIALAVRNDAGTDMPAGLGWHPYFRVLPGLSVHYRAHADWQVGPDYLPTSWHEARQPLRTLDAADWASSECVRYHSHWDGHATLQSAAGTLSLQADGALDHLVAFAPAQAPYVCFEPVSHVADGFNRPDLPAARSGLRQLMPGATLTATIALAWHGA